MAYVPEESRWQAGVYQLEETDLVLGGVDGPSNQPAKDLSSRTRFLYDRMNELSEAINQGRNIVTWEVSEPIAAGTEVMLPSQYTVGIQALMLFSDALGYISPLYFNEVGNAEQFSNKVVFTFDIPAGTQLTEIVLAGNASING